MPYAMSKKQTLGWFKLKNGSYSTLLFDGGARSGKTDLALLWLLAEIEEHPCEEGLRALVVRKYLDHAKTTIFDQSLRKLLMDLPGWTFVEGKHEVKHDNGGLLRVGGLDDADRAEKVLGAEYTHILVDEATQVSWDALGTLRTRLAQVVPGVPVRKLILTCNPRGPRHHLYVAGIRHEDPTTRKPLADADRWGRLHWTPYDNPHLSADYLQTLESLSGVKRRRMLEGIWCSAEGAVYEEFDEDVHVVDHLPIGWERWSQVRGIDFGFTNAFACLWARVDPDGRLWVVGCRKQAQVTIPGHAGAIKSATKGTVDWTVADPEDAGGRAQLAAAGIPTLPANKAVSVGIQTVKDRLRLAGDGRPRLYFLRSTCSDVVEELQSYEWATPKDGKADHEEPVKFNDHCFVAGTMIATDRGQVAIENIKAGSLVWTREGLRRVVDAGMTNRSATVSKVAFDNGACLVGTGGHPVWTENSGWKPLDALRYCDAAKSLSSVDIPSLFTALACVVRNLPMQGKRPVYNLTVEGCPEYFANGILVHNCMDALRYMVMRLDKPVDPRSAAGALGRNAV